MDNAISRPTDQALQPAADVPTASAGAGPSFSKEEDPFRSVSTFFDNFLGHLRKKFQERARGLHRGLPSPFWPFADSPAPAPGTGRCEPADDPIFLALLQYKIEKALKEVSNYPLSRDIAGVLLSAFQGDIRKLNDPVIDMAMMVVGCELITLGRTFRVAGIKWKGMLGVDREDDDAIVPAAYADDGGRSSSSGLTIGIDLGTSYTRAAAEMDGSLEIIRNDKGKHMTPSWVAFSTGDVLIGEDAEEHATVNPERTIFNVKRLIGRRFKDEDVQKDMKLVPYEIADLFGNPGIKLDKDGWRSSILSPEYIVEIILAKIKKDAERTFNKTITRAVVTVPAYFDAAQRRATKYACEEAGLNLVAMINEPTAAAIAYARYKQLDGPKNILVCHLGGGTFDVSILIIDGGAFVVLATSGGKLGGGDIDKTVMRHFIKVIKKKHRKDISRNNRALAKLRRECERAKRVLSSQREVQMEIESLCDGLDFSELLTRDLFEELNGDLFTKISSRVHAAMNDAGLNEDQIDDVVLTGGSSRIPKIRQLLRDHFHGKEPVVEVNPDDEEARDGAAIIGGTLSGTGFADTKDILILDVVHPTAGTEGTNTLIHRNLLILPDAESQVIFTDSRDHLSTDDSSRDFEEETRNRGRIRTRLLRLVDRRVAVLLVVLSLVAVKLIR